MNALSPRLALVALVALVAATTVGACRPLGLEGDACSHGPCAAGLTCVDGVCANVEPPPPPPAPCEADGDCVLDGSADGRECLDDGTCAYAACTLDLQCGVRICENGRCADRELCLNDESCGAGRVCVGNACREACVSDDECPSLGAVPLAACVDGECVQRCLGDFMCLTGICQENLCVAPACNEDDDCEGPGSSFCDTGRCVQFTPCEVEADCFDPNFLCNELGRCEERAACTVDSECGAGLCRDNHCRDAVPCDVAEGCGDDLLECIAGRCVDVPECRADADCDAGEVCDRAACDDPPGEIDASTVVVRTPLGACMSGADGADGANGASTGVCDVTCSAALTLQAQAYDDTGLPAAAAVNGAVDVACDPALGDVDVVVASGDAAVTVRVHPVLAPGDDLVVVVVDGDTGRPVPNALVFVDDASAGVTGLDGVLGVTPFGGGPVGARSQTRGVVVLDAVPGTLFLVLPAGSTGDPVDGGGAAGFRARVNGTGDELGDVGIGLALPSTRGAFAATPAALFGEAFGGSVELPVLGAVPLTLPAAMTLDATLLVVGAQDVKSFAFQTAAPGPGALLALEGRFAQQRLFDIALSADPVEVALDTAALAEGMDALVAGAGFLEVRPLVVDGDLGDGVEDVDGDGDVLELVPDYQSFVELELQPDSSPLERIGLVVSSPPEGANQRALAVCGLDLPHGFLPLGIAAVFGSNDGEQIKVQSAPAFGAAVAHVCVVHAVLGDGTASAALVRAGAFAAQLDAGELLAPPTGAFLLEGVPTAGRTSVVVPESPGADALSVTVVDDDDAVWEIVAGARGTLALPAYIAPASLGATKAYAMSIDVAEALAAARALEDVATAVAVAR